ncbi:hypothetical protein HAX54_046107 [Datura stramonium]|uniref:Uncharacterized protein n=1 Tax=Datura stramonium TaxID=4076 RepID=A0ABS8Y7F3_DATST|nr:hypothetical protein [Datura stramonium]
MKERENGCCLRRRCPVVFRYCCFNRKSWRVWCFAGVLEAMGRGRSGGLVGRWKSEIEGREVRKALRLLSVVVFAGKMEVLSEGGPAMREKRESAAAVLWWWWHGVGLDFPVDSDVRRRGRRRRGRRGEAALPASASPEKWEESVGNGGRGSERGYLFVVWWPTF